MQEFALLWYSFSSLYRGLQEATEIMMVWVYCCGAAQITSTKGSTFASRRFWCLVYCVCCRWRRCNPLCIRDTKTNPGWLFYCVPSFYRITVKDFLFLFSDETLAYIKWMVSVRIARCCTDNEIRFIVFNTRKDECAFNCFTSSVFTSTESTQQMKDFFQNNNFLWNTLGTCCSFSTFTFLTELNCVV